MGVYNPAIFACELIELRTRFLAKKYSVPVCNLLIEESDKK